jgi:uncharacterized ParB-like nuclease family protein
MDVLRIDGDTQPRVAIDQAVVQDYADAIEGGAEFPPVDVVHDGTAYWLVDGFHRFFAHKKLNRPKIRATVTTGLQAEAQWKSLGANKTHGLRRTNADKVKAVAKGLKLKWEMSDSVVAEHVGVSHTMVRRHRQAVIDAQKAAAKGDATLTEFKSNVRTGRDGRGINTARIGRNSPRRKPGGIAKNAFTPVRTGTPPTPMTALSMPHDPVMGARTLIEVFDAEYLHKLVDFLVNHLKGVEA